MTNGGRRTVGLDRLIRLEWLDAVAGRLATGAGAQEAREYIWSLLEGAVAGSTAHSAKGKTLTVLSRVWLTPPSAAAVSLRERAAELIGTSSSGQRLAIHWAMLSAAYPFFVDVAANVGKLISLNGEVALSQLTRRLVEAWGDRSTLRPASQRLIRSMVQWGALRDGEKPGIYLPAEERMILSPNISELLVEGLLIALDKGLPLTMLAGHPAAFPFEICLDPTSLRRSQRFRIYRQGDQTDFVERKELSEAAQPNSLLALKR